MGYDVIGDVHGHADALTALLAKLGYREHRGTWRHPDRTAVFVGDFIDRGPRQLETVTIARRIVDAGSALAVMGNHELNAIAWSMPDPDAPGEFLRPHLGRKGEENRKQHAAFLAAVEGRPDVYAETIGWFLTLPLWLDLGAIRVVHACWHPRFMAFLAPQLAPGNRLTRELMPAATREPANAAEKDTPEPTLFKAVEALTKGIEVPMPAGLTFRDKGDKERDRVRVRWWDRPPRSYRDAALLEEEVRVKLPDAPVPPHALLGHAGPQPVFVGHYWLDGAHAPLTPVAACVDYSIGLGKRLAAYRYDGEPVLEAERFVSVGPGGAD